jgi:hypothetical protein
MMSSSNCSSACSASSRALTCSGSTGDQRRFTAGNARRSAAGLAGKATACASLPTVTRWPFSSSTPHLDLLRQRGGGGRIVSNHHLDGDHRLTRAELAPAVEHGTAQRAVAIEMGGKDKVPVKAGGQFSTLQLAPSKTVCPARRDRRGAQALLSRAQSATVIQLRQLIGKVPFSS